MRRRTTACWALAAAATACVGVPVAAHAAYPVSDAYNKPIEDGCQRNVPGLLSYTSPEWVFVNSATTTDTVKHLEGVVRDPHTAGEDLPEEHLSYDFDFNVIPDPPYTYLAGGSPDANNHHGNGNWDKGSPDEFGQLHLEWESGTLPAYAWPTFHDRVSVWGHWIWDCGHWGQGFDFSAPSSSDPTAPIRHTGDYVLPGQTESELTGTPPDQNIRGEQTELHPLEGIVVTRDASYQSPTRETEADAFMSSTGTAAHADEVCAKQLKAVAGLPAYGPDYTACTHDTSKEYQSLAGRTFSFHVEAPPKPSPNAQLRYRELPQVAGRGATETVIPTASGIDVRVTFGPDPNHAGQSFGASYFVGWEADTSGAPDHLRLTVKTIKVNNSLDPNPSRPQQTGVPPGEYNLLLDLNGRWDFIGGRGPTGPASSVTQPPQWAGASGLGAVTNGQQFTLNHNVDFFVPQGKPVSVFIDARECDLPHMDPCAYTTELSDGNDSPGDHADTFPSVAAALGDHLLKPSTGDYEIAYSIQRIPGSSASPPGASGVGSSSPGGNIGGSGTVKQPQHTSCADVRSPHSRFKGGSLHASRHGLRIAGVASDKGCGHRVARVEISIARRVPRVGGCQWLQTSGRLGPRTTCRNATYLLAHGHSSWSFTLHHSLPSGTYVARVRAVDGAGNREVKHTHGGTTRERNFLTFKIR